MAHPVDWQWQAVGRGNYGHNCIPEGCLTRWASLFRSLFSAYKGVFSGEQKPKRYPFLLMISLCKHSSQRDLFRLRSTLQIICSGQTSLPETFALCVDLKHLPTALMPLHPLRKLIPKYPSSWSADRAFLFSSIEIHTYVLLLGMCTKCCIVCCTRY